MAYQFKFLTPQERAEIVADLGAVELPAPAVDDDLRRAWEADLVAHQALVKTAKGDDKAQHEAAIAALETALTEA